MLSFKGRKRPFDAIESAESCAPSGFRIIDIGMLQTALDDALICGHGKLTICDVPGSSVNLYSAFKIQCKVCSLSTLFSNAQCCEEVMDCRLNTELKDLLTETYFRTLVDYFDAERSKKLSRPEHTISCKQARNDDFDFYIERIDHDYSRRPDDCNVTDREYSEAFSDYEELDNEDNAEHAVKSEAVDVVIYEDEDVVVKTECEDLLTKEIQEFGEEGDLTREEEADLMRECEEDLKREEEEDLMREEEDLMREEEEELKREEEEEEPDIDPQMFLSVEGDLMKASEENEALSLPSLKINSFQRTEGGPGPFLFTKNGGRVLLYENYMYTRNSMLPDKNKIYWKCVQRGRPRCKGNLRTTFFDANEVSHPGNEVVQEWTCHNHDPPESICTLLFINAVKEKIAEDVDQDLKKVYKHVAKEYDDITAVPPYTTIRQQLLRFRNSIYQARGLAHEHLEESCLLK